MIVHVNNKLSAEKIAEIAAQLQAIHVPHAENVILVTPAALKKIPDNLQEFVTQTFPMESDMQLSSKKYLAEKRSVSFGQGIQIGGNTGNMALMAGPCSVESPEQIEVSAQLMQQLGISTLRAGCFKPRTSPYSFQGLGLEGLKLLDAMRSKYKLNIITEVRDATHIEEVIEYADIIQIGAKSMYDHGILRRCGKARKPVLLKRGFGTTLQEFVQAAEFILSGGNEQVVLCERGIRTFETKTRFTLDLCGAAYLKEYTNLPLVLDPSHAIGYAYGVPDLARACTAMGIDGLLIEVHPNPAVALSDASQQLNHEQFTELTASLKTIAQSIHRNIV